MEYSLLPVAIVLTGVIVVAVLGLIFSTRTSTGISQMNASFTAMRKRNDDLSEENALFAGEVQKLKSQDWCNKNRPPMVGL
jgi:hypothetical protein